MDSRLFSLVKALDTSEDAINYGGRGRFTKVDFRIARASRDCGCQRFDRRRRGSNIKD